ncbi:PREDICTED: uncharacterized protein LOC107073513 [Polistes dominula]|uniref:Uncharacterized protein LOC107073513 n=1 Tax=Polistes dominula TaxID=743375 RepID=A0ABM1JB50_POLDO|nr:PREDICTED: uncharacterized protein LOC107073513 [Polistes dominula]
MGEFQGILPIDEHVIFIDFDRDLGTKPDARLKLMNLYNVLIYGEENITKCIKKTISSTISSKIQLLYSGTGKKIKGVGKLNFSEINIFKCLRDATQEKFGDSDQMKNFITRTSVFLANAGDRDGRRKIRAAKSANQHSNNEQIN